jgi:hypothetical protein
MNTRHAAALALVGWYLIAPPPARPRPSSNSAPPNESAPLNKWTIWSSYDSAKVCESARKKNLDAAAANLDKWNHLAEQRHGIWDQKFLNEDLGASDQFEYAFDAHCVSTGDRPLKEK